MSKPVLSSGMVKLIKKPWLWLLAVVVSAAIWTLVFYWASRTPIEKKFNVWVGAPFELNDGLKQQIEDACHDGGMKDIYITSYNPDDYSYAIAFSMQASSTDIFILHKDEAAFEAEAMVFKALPDRYKGESAIEYTYTDDDGKSVTETIGVKFAGDYYVFIGRQSVKDDSLLYSVLDLIAEYGANAMEESEQ